MSSICQSTSENDHAQEPNAKLCRLTHWRNLPSMIIKPCAGKATAKPSKAHISDEMRRLLEADLAGCKKSRDIFKSSLRTTATLASRGGACDRNNTRGSQSLWALGAAVSPKPARSEQRGLKPVPPITGAQYGQLHMSVRVSRPQLVKETRTVIAVLFMGCSDSFTNPMGYFFHQNCVYSRCLGQID